MKGLFQKKYLLTTLVILVVTFIYIYNCFMFFFGCSDLICKIIDPLMYPLYLLWLLIRSLSLWFESWLGITRVSGFLFLATLFVIFYALSIVLVEAYEYIYRFMKMRQKLSPEKEAVVTAIVKKYTKPHHAAKVHRPAKKKAPEKLKRLHKGKGKKRR